MSKVKEEKARLEIVDNCIFSWDKQPGEGQVQYRLFTLYLDIGKTRNYRKAAELCERSYTNICSLGNQFQWKMRSFDYDDCKDREMRVELDAEILKNRLRQMQIGQKLQELAERGTEMLLENIEDLKPQDVAKLADTGNKLINLALGSSTEIKETKMDAKIEVQVETIPPEIAAKLGRELAIAASEDMEINV